MIDNTMKKKPDPEYNVLIVDDSFLMRRVIKNILESDESFNVVGEAVDGLDALEKVAELSPEIILLDIEMPRLDGVGFLKEAKLLTDAIIIVISSVTRLGSPQAVEALHLGVADIICKPSGVLSMDLEKEKSQELLDAIHQCVDNYQ